MNSMNRLERELDFKLSRSSCLAYSLEQHAIPENYIWPLAEANKNCPALIKRGTMKKSRAVSLRRIASPHPRSISIRKQVSRLGFILLGRLPAGNMPAVAALCPFVGFTVTGVARSFHPYSLGGSVRQRLFRRRCIRYSFRHSIRSIAIRVNGESEVLKAPKY